MKTLIPTLGMITAATIAIITEGDIGIARVLLLLLASVVLIFLFLSVAKHPADKRSILLRYGIAFGMIGSLALSPWIFTLRFAQAENALRLLAHRVRTSDPIAFPVWAGTFRISAGGTKGDGSLFLWIHSDPSGPAGFVFDYKGSGYNLWAVRQLHDGCYYISED